MKRLLVLLAVATLPAASGCCCARLCPFCPCNWFSRGPVCAPYAAPVACAPAATYVPSPCAPTYAPACATAASLCPRPDFAARRHGDATVRGSANDAASSDVLPGSGGRQLLCGC